MRDVIVTNGARWGLCGGRESIGCAPPERPLSDFISAWSGADPILGSSSDEIVVANDEAAGEVDRDTIDMGGGDDVVTTGGEGNGAGAGEDVIALGEGRDLLRVTGPGVSRETCGWTGS